MIRNGETGDWIGTFQGHKGAVWCARLNATATHALTGSADYSAKLWNALTGEIMFTFNHPKIVKSVDFLADGENVVTGGVEGGLRVFSITALADAPTRHYQNAHAQPIKAVVPTLNNTLITAAADAAIRIWDTRLADHVKEIKAPAPVTSIDLTHDQKYLVASYAKSVVVYDAASFEVVKKMDMTYDVNSAALSPDHATLVAGGSNFWVHTYNFNSEAQLDVFKGHHGPVHCVRWSHTGHHYASGSEDGTIRIWPHT
jgi:serine-threonine kinase receptor-associated protein